MNLRTRDMRALTTPEFIAKAVLTHGDRFDYSKVVYVNSRTKVCIICPEHGEFWQLPYDHIGGKSCRECGKTRAQHKRLDAFKDKRPDLSHIETPPGSKAVPVGTKGDYALVDEEDYDGVMQYNWYLTAGGYAYNDRVGNMHRFIMNPPDDMVVDHINHNPLDNRKSELRICTQQQNTFNAKAPAGKTSIYKGVSWDSVRGKWLAQISVGGNNRHLGRFDKEEDAAWAYNKAAEEAQGEFARLNEQYNVGHKRINSLEEFKDRYL